MLDAHRFLRGEEQLVAIDRRGKLDAFLGDFAQRPQGKDLKATRIREDWLVPAHELVQAAVCADHFKAGA